MSTIGELIVKIGADATSLSKGLDTATNKTKASATQMKAAIGAIGVAAAGFLSSAVSAATNAEKVNANLAQTVKSTGGAAGMTVKELGNLASKLQETTTFSAGTIKAGEAMLLTFTNIGKDVFPQATSALLDLSQKMGTEPQQAAIQLGKALNDPVKGITALKRVGVSFNETQTETIKKMVESGNVAGAQKIILAELNKEFGGQAAAAANTYAGKVQQMTNQMNSMKVSIGTALLPVLMLLAKGLMAVITPLISIIKEHPKLSAMLLTLVAVAGTLFGGASLLGLMIGSLGPLGPALTKIATSFKSLLVPIGQVIKALGLMALEFTKTAAKAIASAATTIASWIRMGAQAVVQAARVVASWALMGVQALINAAKMAAAWVIAMGPIAWVTAAAVALVALVIANWDTVSKKTKEIWGAVSTYLSNIWNSIVEWGKSKFGQFKDFFLGIWAGIVAGLKGYVNGIIGNINAVIGALNAIHVKIPDWVPEYGGKAFSLNMKRVAYLDTGTNYVDRDTFAVIHEGEAVVPKKYNPAAGAKVSGGNNVSIDYDKMAAALIRAMSAANFVARLDTSNSQMTALERILKPVRQSEALRGV